MKKTALLIIDVQQGLCTGDFAAFGIAAVIEKINAIGAKARATGVPVFLIQHEEDEGPLQFDTPGWQLTDALSVSPADPRVRKTTPNSFYRTDLQTRLEALGVGRLIVCGLQSEYCVDTTVRAALALGFEVALVADAHSTLDNDVLSAAQITAHHNATLGHMTSFEPRMSVVPASELKIDA